MSGCVYRKLSLFTKWLNTDPTATWRDVLNALTKIEEINLSQTIDDELQVHQCTGGMIMYLYTNNYRIATKFQGNKLSRIRPEVFFCELTFVVFINFRGYGKSTKTAKVVPSKLSGYMVYPMFNR